METFFLACAIIGGALFLVKVALALFGFAHDGGDIGAVHDVDSGLSEASFKLLSLQGITAFFIMFGLVGYSLLHSYSFPALGAVVGGLVAGTIAILLIAWIFSLAQKLQSSGTLDLANAVGQEGTMYLRIPAGGTGKAQVIVQGRSAIFDARTGDGIEIKSGERIKVVGVVGNNILTVQKL